MATAENAFKNKSVRLQSFASLFFAQPLHQHFNMTLTATANGLYVVRLKDIQAMQGPAQR